MSDSTDPKERRNEACMMCCKVVFAIILPPIAVLLERGCGCSLCLNILLTLLGWIPGMIHAFFVILGGEQYDHIEEEARRKREAEKKEKEAEQKKREEEEKKRVAEEREKEAEERKRLAAQNYVLQEELKAAREATTAANTLATPSSSADAREGGQDSTAATTH